MEKKGISKLMEELDENPETTAKDWELLAGACLAGEDYVKASICFSRADAIKDRVLTTRTAYGKPKQLRALVAAPWDQPASAEA